MANLRSRFRQILGCVLTAGMMVGGMNLTVLPVSATEIEAESSEEPLSGNFGASRLTGVSLNVYKYLKEAVRGTADGSKPNAEYDITEVVTTAEEARELSNNLGTIYDYLLMDCPYELYWYDKSAKDPNPRVEGAVDYTYSYAGDRATDVKIRMLVSKEYRSDSLAGNSDSWYYTVDTGLISAARMVPAKAQAIVDANAGKTDYQKMLAYKNAICDRVVYDEAAIGPGYNASNKPWQLISVFDDDPNTNVVCEGYSKAFQYLCDLSEFSNARCYTVSGGMAGGTGGGAHMWNIVSIDGGNYLVDVTDCDEGTIGAPDLLFLAVPSEGSWDTQYNFSVGLNYKYDNEMLGLFGEEILKLSGKSYDPSTSQAAPVRPGNTGTPDNSGQPGTPDIPDNSGQPSTPETPDNSGQPNTPETPDTSVEEKDPEEKPEEKEPEEKEPEKKDPEKTEGSDKTDTAEKDEDADKPTFDVVSMDTSDGGEYKAVEECIRAMYVRNGDELEFVDASKIEELVRSKLSRKHRISASNVQVHEISLKVKNEKGEWEVVSAENFPKDGIQITMPYPKGTGKEGYLFYGQHLFAEDVNEYKAGTTEDLEIVKEDKGITFVVHGLSPVSVGWSQEEKDENSEASASEGTDQQTGTAGTDQQSGTTGTSPQGTSVKSPKTSDGNVILMYEIVMLLAMGIIIGMEARSRSSRRKEASGRK